MPRPLTRRSVLLSAVCSAASAVLAPGCTAPLFRSQSEEAPDGLDKTLSELSEEPKGVRMVGDLAVPWGLNWLKVEGVALVTHLSGTGSDPPPSPLRDMLIKEMQTHDVKNYSKALASDDTSLVVVQGYIPPAAMKDDLFDVQIRIPDRSKTTSLQNGWVVQCRLREYQRLDTMREGHVVGLASGSILIDAVFNNESDPVALTRGRIPGGGVVQKDRPLGLAISNEHSSVRTSALIGAAINDRFHHFDRGSKRGVANPKRDDLIELAVHPRYRHNLGRYIRVIRSIAVGESPAARTSRMSTLRQTLLEPTSAELAALRLEAIGTDSATDLRAGLASPYLEVRFYAAEALAYLNDPSGVQVLRDAAERERALRWRALTALAAIDSYEAQETLATLLHVPSAETRYGAFRALRLRNPRDPLVRGDVLNREFAYHRIPSAAEPLLHFSRTRRPELVVFGTNLQLQMKAGDFFYAGKTVLVKAVDGHTLQVSCFRPGKEDKFEQCSTQLEDLIQAVAAVEGTYADLFDGLRSAKSRGFLTARVEVDALPRGNRRFQPKADGSSGEQSELHVKNAVPEMFMDRLQGDADDETARHGELEEIDPPADAKQTERGLFDRMTSWMSE